MKLLSPIQFDPYALKDRVIMAPLTRGRPGENRIPNSLMQTY